MTSRRRTSRIDGPLLDHPHLLLRHAVEQIDVLEVPELAAFGHP
jgi:hypothetical protein